MAVNSLEENLRDDTIGDLRSTTDGYIDGNRTTNPPFEVDRKIAKKANERMTTGVGHLLAADAGLAKTAINDAKRSQNALQQRDISYNESHTSEQIAAAKKAYQAAQNKRRNETTLQDAISAFEKYQSAWNHAQAALDTMDQSLSPQITIETQRDPIHNTEIKYTIEGRIFDIRPYELSEVSVVLNKESQTNFSVQRNTAPATVATFTGNISLQKQRNKISLAVTDQASFEDANSSVQVGKARLLLDGDGLPAKYERRVLGTAPLNPNSDSNMTDETESSNKVIDGREDFDRDSLIALVEMYAGTDHFSSDTDGDALSDRVEVKQLPTSAIRSDTDNDGVLDNAEDLDGDGLETGRELQIGTSPTLQYTDEDDLSDKEELNLGTDPTVPDTDNDGLTDGQEVGIAADPTVADTDRDGILDGREKYRVRRDQDTDTSVTIESGDANAASMTIVNTTSQFINNGSTPFASPVVDIEADGNATAATIKLPYDPKSVQNISNVKVLRFDLVDREYERISPQSVAPSEQTVTVQTEGFSSFALINPIPQGPIETAPKGSLKGDGDKKLASNPFSKPNTGGGGNIVYQSDFEYDNPSTRRGWRIVERSQYTGLYYSGGVCDSCLEAIVYPQGDNIKARHSAAFNANKEFTVQFDIRNSTTGFYYDPKPFTLSLTTASGTNLRVEVTAGEQSRIRLVRPSTDEVVVLDEMYRSGEYNITLIGDGTDEIAVQYNGNPVGTLDISGIDRFRNVEVNFTGNFQLVDYIGITQGGGTASEPEGRDTDGDGIPNHIEREGIQLSVLPGIDIDTSLLKTDPNDADTDNDGVDDGYELNINANDNLADGVKTIRSYPNKTDSDEDGLNDSVELNGYLYILTAEKYPTLEYELQTDPLAADTDGDNLTDGYEVNLSSKASVPDEDAIAFTAPRSLPNTSHTDGDNLGDWGEDAEQTNAFVPDTDGDGLGDGLEVQGIPAPALSKTFCETAVRRSNAIDLDNDGIKDGVKTDPLNPDTDGDTLSDGHEIVGPLSEFTSSDKNVDFVSASLFQAIGRGIPYSDPSDPNTDDVGLNDSQELKKGSNPIVDESLTIAIKYPVKAKKVPPGTGSAGSDKDVASKKPRGRYVVAPTALQEATKLKQCGGAEGRSKPTWLDDADIQCDKSYYKIPVVVSVTGQPQPDTTDLRSPYSVEFSLRDGGEPRLIQLSSPILEYEQKSTYIILETGSSDVGKVEMGRLVARVYMPDESVFLRQSDGSGGSFRYITLVSTNLDRGKSLKLQASKLTGTTASKFYSAYMQTWGVYQAVYGVGFAVVNSQSKRLFKTAVDDFVVDKAKEGKLPVPFVSSGEINDRKIEYVKTFVTKDCVVRVEKLLANPRKLYTPKTAGEKAKCAQEVVTALLKWEMKQSDSSGPIARGTMTNKTYVTGEGFLNPGVPYVFRSIIIVREN